MARPSIFTEERATTICDRIAKGESLKAICGDAKMPSETTVRNWLKDNAEFVRQYACAREAQADFYADEIVTIADEATDANIARVRIDARKWKASKLAPKKYGDRLELEHSGEMTVMTPDQRRAEIARLSAKLHAPDA
jgi:hypothetical protein